MSLKRYLFLAFGSLMLLFIAVQLLLLTILADDFHQTLGEQSGEVARRVAEVTVESLFDEGAFRIEVPEPVLPPGLSPEQREQIEQNREALQQSLEAEQHRQHALQQEMEALKEHEIIISQQLHSLSELPYLSREEQARIKAELAEARAQALEQASRIKVEFEKNGDRVRVQGLAVPLEMHLVQPPEQRLLNEFKHTLLWLLGGSGLVGLVLVYWLAQRLSRPLEALDEGCQRLSEGELGHTLPSQGSSEVRHAIDAFNHMSQSLARMTEEQKTLQSRQHLAEIGEIARGLAHALRNPLHTIGLALERLDRAAPEERTRWREQIRGKLRHMDRTLTALLTLAANGIDRSTGHSARALVDDIILELSMAGGTTIRFDNRVPEDLTLIGAHSELRTMVHTLMVNAMEAMQEQTGEEPVLIEARRLREGAGARVAIVVSDAGPGIAASVAERLFEPHQTTKADGSGMGLYLARRLARLWYGGDVNLSNRESGPGCRATLTLQQGPQL
ncbi:sensor histidine kinase [Ferrimonas balearica]|uniref:sensor histidine kinase n=1 Tax=Ferrimonas balearica TaxID=44012 RepID=UPI001C99095B|nr:HAMP domain-containing sensor histidine kinase [Ferrimonas balearica]MBY5922056.1 HAMP domain-containing protein [Ferrimonas balearica]MBY5994604.1 HAMP domain-containing protein [Ferrimonas balearica]